MKGRISYNAKASATLNETKTKISVHHTVTPTSASGGYEQRIRGIQNFHMDTNGWCDVGSGVLDWPALWTAARAAGANWMVVEHDNPARRLYERCGSCHQGPKDRHGRRRCS